MEIIFAPLPYASHKTGQALSGCLLLNDKVTLAPFSPVKCKTQKIKCPPLFAFFLREWFAESNQGCLIRMKAQIVPVEPLWQNLHDSLCIRFVLETDNEIIGPSNEKASAL